MRRQILQLLRCPKCRRGGLHPESDTAELVFGPIRCGQCHASFPVSEGIADLVTDRGEVGPMQRGLEQPVVARSYERYIRPVIQLALSRRRLDRESEALLYRSMLGAPAAPILDLGCGTGLFARRIAQLPDAPAMVGMDVSKPMLEEAMAQAREAGATVDLVRAEAPFLPFTDGSLGGVLQAHSLHLVQEAEALFLEVERVLRPGARYVASTYLPPRFPARVLHQKAGLFPRAEDELRRAVQAVGLTKFERVLLPPFLVLKAEKPATSQDRRFDSGPSRSA